MQACFESAHYADLFLGTATNEPALRFTGQILHHTQDIDLIKRTIKSALPEDYSGDTMDEVEGMVLRGLAKGFADEKPSNRKKSTLTVAQIAIEDVMRADVVLFHDLAKTPYLIIKDAQGRGQVHKVASEMVRHFIAAQFYRNQGRPISTNALKETVSALAARALFEGFQAEVHLRVARKDNCVVFNPANQNGVVIVGPENWEVVKESPVHFLSANNMKPVPTPTRNGSFDDLQRLLALDDANFNRVLAFIFSCFKPEGPYLVLLVEGEQGSGKSYLCTLLKAIIDPTVPMKSRLPSTERDLMVYMLRNHLLVFDNVSSVRNEMSDALCTVATHGGIVLRKLYENDEQQIFEGCRPIILNGIDGVSSRPDLIERAVLVKLDSMPREKRKSEAEMQAEFDRILPGLLGCIFDVLVTANALFAEVETPRDIRMADAARWIAAAEKSPLLAGRGLISALKESQREAVMDHVATDVIANALVNYLKEKPFDGYVGDLFKELKDRSFLDARAFKGTSSHFSKELTRLKPALEKAGVNIELGKKTREGRPVKLWLDASSFDESMFEEQEAPEDDGSISV